MSLKSSIVTSYWPIKSINHENLEGKDTEIFLGMKLNEEQDRLVSQQVIAMLKNEPSIKVDYEHFCYSVIYYKCKMMTL